MTYGEIRNASLNLIGRYSHSGEPFALSYNGQQDYVNKIPFLVNDCLVYIASSAKRIPARTTLLLSDGEDVGRYLRFALPTDLLEPISGGLYVLDYARGARRAISGCIFQLPGHVLLPKPVPEGVVLEYYRQPTLVPMSGPVPDGTTIDAPLDVQMCIPYYVAAHLVIEDDPYKYSSLLNEFESKLARLEQPKYTEVHTVTDVYGFGGDDVGY